MRKALVLYNPLAGNRQARRRQDIDAVVATLRAGGVEVSAEPTQGAAESSVQAQQAVQTGYDTVFACGGDGTINDILQGMVGSNAALGIIPLGTANVVAHDLALPLSPPAAARMALSAERRRIAIGKVEYTALSGKPAARFFLAVIGIGIDAHLFYKLNAAVKNRLGMASYYVRATHLWLTHNMESFAVEFTGAGETKLYADVPQLLAVRIRNFGGALRELAPGASLTRNDFRLVLFRTRSRLAYLRYIMRGLVGANWAIKGIEHAYSDTVVCRPLGNASRIFVEVDGELLGTLPARISIVPDAVTLLAPPTNR